MAASSQLLSRSFSTLFNLALLSLEFLSPTVCFAEAVVSCMSGVFTYCFHSLVSLRYSTKVFVFHTRTHTRTPTHTLTYVFIFCAVCLIPFSQSSSVALLSGNGSQKHALSCSDFALPPWPQGISSVPLADSISQLQLRRNWGAGIHSPKSV